MGGGKKQKVAKDPTVNPSPSPSQLIKSEDNPITSTQWQETMDKVFSNDMLREKILGYVIYSTSPSTFQPTSDRQINYKDIRNLRLVQKSWLLTTSRILRQNRHPLYCLHDSSTVRVPTSENPEENEERITSFIQTMTRPKRWELQLAPFKLELQCPFFIPENQKILVDLFEKCASGLVSLVIVIPKSCTMPLVLPPFSLGILQHLTIEFASHSHNDPGEVISPTFLENIGVTYFIQQLINSTSELRSLEFKCPSSPFTEASIIPLGFQFLKLPPTVGMLLLRGPFSSNHLEVTAPRNPNGHLTTLQIRASVSSPFLNDNTIYKILEGHRATMKFLKLSGGQHSNHLPDNDLQEPSLFKIPPMKNLQKFFVTSPKWLTANNFYMTSVNFPKMTEFYMRGVSVALFERLTAETRRLRLNGVKTVEVWLVDHSFGSTITLDKEKMERVHWTFHNVTSLEITISGTETSGVKYIFREMGSLKSLAIIVRKSNVGEGSMTCATWDGLLLGAPEWIAKGLRETPDYWENFQGKSGYDNNPSIMKLTALTKLTLATKRMCVHYLQNGDLRDRMLSEVAFHFALVKMPQLKALELFGRFQPNEQMILLWLKKRDFRGSDGGETLLYDSERKDSQ